MLTRYEIIHFFLCQLGIILNENSFIKLNTHTYYIHIFVMNKIVF